jgi:hypothetical protein
MAVPARPVSGAPIDSAWGGVAHDTAVALDYQTGLVSLTHTAANLSAVVPVTFPRPFATGSVPIVILGSSFVHYMAAYMAGPTATGFSAQSRRTDGTTPTATIAFPWLAIGPRA